MNRFGGHSATTIARAYFALQAVGGALWWISVFTVDGVAGWTLGEWSPNVVVGPDLALFVGASAIAAVAPSPRVGRLAAAVVAGWSLLVTVALTFHGLIDRTAGAGVVLMSVATAGSALGASQLWFGKLRTEWFFLGPFSFRVAPTGSRSGHLRRSLVQLVIFWSFFFGVVPLVLAAIEDRLRIRWTLLDTPVADIIGAVVLAMASALGIWSCVTMAVIGNGTPLPAQTARDLVIAGPYRLVRNPMAVAGALQTAAVGFIVGSWTVMAIAVVGALAWNFLIRPTEEADLAARFGSSYDEYTATVSCWVTSRAGSSTGHNVCHPADDV